VDRTAVAQQRQDERHHVGRSPPPGERRARGGGEGPATAETAIPLLHLAMYPNVPVPHLPSGRALGVMAAWGLRVHGPSPPDAILPAQANHVR
jgi:hypothetical protein